MTAGQHPQREQPEREYIITESRLKKISMLERYSPSMKYQLSKVRSRKFVHRTHSGAGEPVYSYKVSVPSKAFPCIKRRKLALNEIGDDEDEFTRLNFELQDGDIIQVIRGAP